MMLSRSLGPSSRGALPLGARGFASEKDVKKRMMSVKTIVKITKSSKLIASAKFKAAENAVKPVRPITETFLNFWGKVSGLGVEGINLVTETEAWTPPNGEADFGKLLVVPMTADKGLCGGVNSCINRPIRKRCDASAMDNVSFILVGDRAKAALGKAFGDRTHCAITGVSKMIPVGSGVGMIIAAETAKVDYDHVMYIWNRFDNAIGYTTTVTRLPSFSKMTGGKVGIEGYEIEGNEEEVLENLHEYSHAVLTYSFLCENSAVEQSQRMTAMENSTKNAEELIEKLHLRYNRMRQSRITTELTEIISGAAAVESAD